MSDGVHPVHVCLVSNQPVPSLAPLIDPALEVEQAVLVAAPERRQEADWLQQAVARYQVASEVVPLADGYDLPSIREGLEALRERLGVGPAVNLTGGTKLMTLAAWEVFNRPEDALYYVQIKDDRIDWLRPADRPGQAVGERLRLEPYLLAHGARCRADMPPLRHPLPRERRRLAEEMARDRRLPYRLTGLAAKWRGDARPRKGTLAHRLHQAGLLVAATEDDQAGQGPAKAVAAFAGGAWLEELVHSTIERLRSQDPLIHDLARQFVIRRGTEASPLDNEVDVACLRDNTLYLVECKSGRREIQGEAGQENLRKLAHLRDRFGGLRGRCMLVSRYPLSAQLEERARELRVDVLVPDGGEGLARGLEEWLQQPPGA